MASYNLEVFGGSENLKIQYVVSHSFNPDLTDNITWGDLQLTKNYSLLVLDVMDSVPTLSRQSLSNIMMNSNGIVLKFQITFYIKDDSDANIISELYKKSQNDLFEDAPYFNFIPDSTSVIEYVTHMKLSIDDDGSKCTATFEVKDKQFELPTSQEHKNVYYFGTGETALNAAQLQSQMTAFFTDSPNITRSYSPTNEKVYFLSPTIRTKFPSILGSSGVESLGGFLDDIGGSLTFIADPRVETIFGNTYYIYETVNLITEVSGNYIFRRDF